jgi:hypothetical protein
VTPRAQPSASKGVRSRADRLIRLSLDDIVKLLFVLGGGDGVVGAFGCRLVGSRSGALLKLRLVLIDDRAVVGAFSAPQSADNDEGGHDTQKGLSERWRAS